MRITRHKWVAAVVIVATICIILSFEWMKWNSDPAPASEEFSLSAWVVDWQLRAGMEDYEVLANRLNSFQLFALYFNDEDALHFTPQLQEELPLLLERIWNASEKDVYLTVVNDVWHKDGTAVQKDSSLVTRLMATEQSRHQHIQELIELATVYQFDGIEIDYERIAESDWDHLTAFYRELHALLNDRNMKLRVVFEPRAPIEELAPNLPEGVEYVVMAYNLYGSHSGPGPKADLDFLRTLVRRTENVPGGMSIALSTGGFSWTEEGKVTAITELQGEQLAKQYQADLHRDSDSSVIYFNFTDEEGVQFTVWYADATTLELWIETLKDVGINRVAIWRLGDLGLGSLKYLGEAETIENPSDG